MKLSKLNKMMRQTGSIAMEGAMVVAMISALGMGFFHYGTELAAKEKQMFSQILGSIDSRSL